MIGIEIQLRDNLNLLIKHFGISDSELSKKTDIPQQTIHRLKSGATPDPRISTLKTLADFFEITVGQLIGNEPIIIGAINNNGARNLLKIPLISWNQAYTWESISKTLTEKTHSQWVYTDQVTSKNSFALKIQTREYDTQFPHSSMIFVDCSIPMTSSCYGVFSDHLTRKISLKKIIDDMSGIYLFHPTITSFSIKFDDKKNSFLGTIVGITIYLDKPSI